MQGKPVSRRWLAMSVAAAIGLAPLAATAQTTTPPPPAPTTPAPTTPAQPASPSATPAAPKAAAPATPDKAGTPPAAAPATPEPRTPEPKTPDLKTPDLKTPELKTQAPASPQTPGAAPLAPGGTPQTHEVEPNGAPQTPGTATMETIQVPARPIALVEGRSSYDDAFKSIKASLATVKAAMDKAGLTAAGHPITIFIDTDDKGFKYEAAIPIAAKPEGKTDLGDGVRIGESPAGSGLKFRHRGPFDEIDSTYDLIVAYLDEKGLQIDPPYIEEYLDDLTTPDDPKLAVDIYTFIKK